jgi:hypothetical protein
MFGAMSIGDVMMRRASARKEEEEGKEEKPVEAKAKAKPALVVDEDESSSVDEAGALQEVSVSSSSEDKEEPPKQETLEVKVEEKHEPIPAPASPAAPPEVAVKPPPAKRAPVARQHSAPRRMVTREQSDVCFMLFRQHDTDNSGGLSPAEVKLLLQEYQLGIRSSDEEAEMAVKLLSRSGAAEISYLDFKSWWFDSSYVCALLVLLNISLGTLTTGSSCCSGRRRSCRQWCWRATCLRDLTRTETG